MQTVYKNIRFYVPDKTHIAEIQQVGDLIDSYNVPGPWIVAWNVNNHYMWKNGRQNAPVGIFPSGNTMEIFTECIKAYFEGTPHALLRREKVSND